MNKWININPRKQKPTVENLKRLRKSQGMTYRFKIKDNRIVKKRKIVKKYSPSQIAESEGWSAFQWSKEKYVNTPEGIKELKKLKMRNPKYEFKWVETWFGTEMALMRRYKK